jgi:hypothetical protein
MIFGFWFSKVGCKQNTDEVICDIVEGCLRQLLNAGVLELHDAANVQVLPKAGYFMTSSLELKLNRITKDQRPE